MILIKKPNGITTTTKKPIGERVVREDTLYYRDPIDLVTGTITMDNFFTLAQCKRTTKRK